MGLVVRHQTRRDLDAVAVGAEMVWFGSPIRTLSSASRPPSDSAVCELNCVATPGSGLVTLILLIPYTKVLVAVGIRFTDDQMTLHTVPACVAAEAPDNGFLHLENATRLHLLVDREGIDLGVGRVRLAWCDKAQARTIKTIKRNATTIRTSRPGACQRPAATDARNCSGDTQLAALVIDTASCRPQARARSISPSRSGPSTSST